MCEYESHSKMYDNLTEIQKIFPEVAKVNFTCKMYWNAFVLNHNFKVGSIGESALEKPLYYIKLSKNVNQRSLMRW